MASFTHVLAADVPGRICRERGSELHRLQLAATDCDIAPPTIVHA